MKNIIILMSSLLFLLSCSSKNGKDLIEAVKANNLEKVRKIADIKNVNATDEAGASSFMWAAFNGNVEIMKHLLSKGADCDKPGIISIDNIIRIYSSPIHAATGEGHIDAVKLIIQECKTDININLKKINRFAVFDNDIRHSEEFMSFLQTVNDEITGVIKYEYKIKNKKFTKFALGRYLSDLIVEADLNKIINSKKSENPFTRMINNRKIIDKKYEKYVVKKECYDFFDCNNSPGETLLTVASFRGHKELVKYFVSEGADLFIKDSDGFDPLYASVLSGNYDISNYLLDKGAVASAIEKNFSISIIQSLHMDFFKKENREIKEFKSLTERLIKAGADINNKDIWGDTVLKKVCEEKDGELVEFLVSMGADPEIEVDGKKIKDICKENGVETKDEWFKKKAE